jgi:hypothetical protein
MIVCVIKDWHSKDTFIRQSPNNDGVWNGIKFVFGKIQRCDYLIVWNRPPYDIDICCREGGKWLIAGEPPTYLHRPYLKAYKYFDIAFSQFKTSEAKLHLLTNGALPWHVNRSYSELINLEPGKGNKKNLVSCVSSNLNNLDGHLKRLKFLKYLTESKFDFDLFGRGINPIDDKFDALYPYKYSIAIENSSYPHYWTEKIADCFLSWTMPIYYGCSNITSYFPSGSMINIDINKPQEALELIKEAVAEDRWNKNLDAIAEARLLVLNNYQFFPKMAEFIKANSNNSGSFRQYKIPQCQGFWETKPTVFQKILNKLNFRSI